MNQQKMSTFISERRKQMNFTQRELAEKLGISDKAVSKWERGLNCPDISLLPELSALLGVSINELLNGECLPDAEPEINTTIASALQYMDTAKKKETTSLRIRIGFYFTGILLLGLITCIICDLAISQTFTWSLYPIAAIVFSWLVTMPLLVLPKNGDLLSLGILTLLILPFFWILNSIMGGIPHLLEIAVPVSLLSLCFLWILCLLFHKCKSKLIAAGASALLAIPLAFFINLCLMNILHEPVIDVWDFFSYVSLLLLALVFFVLHNQKKKKAA